MKSTFSTFSKPRLKTNVNVGVTYIIYWIFWWYLNMYCLMIIKYVLFNDFNLMLLSSLSVSTWIWNKMTKTARSPLQVTLVSHLATNFDANMTKSWFFLILTWGWIIRPSLFPTTMQIKLETTFNINQKLTERNYNQLPNDFRNELYKVFQSLWQSITLNNVKTYKLL